MGLYDYITCEYPLPDGFDGELVYQTKDTPRQVLSSYVIDEEGKVIEMPDEHLGISEPRVIEHHGVLDFHTSNVSCIAGFGYCTDDGKPHWYRGYTALYDHGKLLKIEGGLSPESGGPFIWGSATPNPREIPLLTRKEWMKKFKEDR